jgi:hypothetical protein
MNVCDHCGTPVRLEYRPKMVQVRWTHDTGPVGRWSCPRPDGGYWSETDEVPTMASVDGIEVFDGGIVDRKWQAVKACRDNTKTGAP